MVAKETVCTQILLCPTIMESSFFARRAGGGDFSRDGPPYAGDRDASPSPVCIDPFGRSSSKHVLFVCVTQLILLMPRLIRIPLPSGNMSLPFLSYMNRLSSLATISSATRLESLCVVVPPCVCWHGASSRKSIPSNTCVVITRPMRIHLSCLAVRLGFSPRSWTAHEDLHLPRCKTGSYLQVLP